MSRKVARALLSTIARGLLPLLNISDRIRPLAWSESLRRHWTEQKVHKSGRIVSGVITNYTASSWLERSFSLSFAISFACFFVSRDCSGVISSLFNVSAQAVVSRRALVQSAVFPLWSHQLHEQERLAEEWKTLPFFLRKFALPPSLILNESNRMCSGNLFSYSVFTRLFIGISCFLYQFGLPLLIFYYNSPFQSGKSLNEWSAITTRCLWRTHYGTGTITADRGSNGS